jgi:aminoglycoside phosphotransferase (APT) family kinase protein
MVQRIGASADMLYSQCLRVQQHQSTLPQTLLHGDMHLGNTYAVGGAGGLVDWQLMARGHFMHDVGYYIITALDVARRRTHERELIAFYLDRLAAEGVRDPPDLDTAWNEYRLIPAWSVYIGWLPCTDLNYGWEIAVIAHLRVTTAYEDLETAKAIAALD